MDGRDEEEMNITLSSPSHPALATSPSTIPILSTASSNPDIFSIRPSTHFGDITCSGGGSELLPQTCCARY